MRAVAAAPAEVARLRACVVWPPCATTRASPSETIDLIDRALVDGSWLGHPFAVHQGHFFRVDGAAASSGVRSRRSPPSTPRRCWLVRSGEVGERFTGATNNARSWVLRSLGRFDEADEVNLRVFESTGQTAQTMEMHCASALDLLDGQLLTGDVDAIDAAIDRARVVDTFAGHDGVAPPPALHRAAGASCDARRRRRHGGRSWPARSSTTR